MNYFINAINTLSHLNINEIFYKMFDNQYFIHILSILVISVLFVNSLFNKYKNDTTKVENHIQTIIELESIRNMLKTKYSKRINLLISEKETLENINNNLKLQCQKYSDDNEKIKKKIYENSTVFLYRKKNSGTKVHTNPNCISLKNQIDRIYVITRKDLGFYVDNECVCAHCSDTDNYVSRYINLYSIKTNNSKNLLHLSNECQHLQNKEVKKSVYDYSNYLLMIDFDLICITCQNTKESDFKDELNI
tara:strand:- start:1022 stop:1768 length:747 start_codon:yes stop_codon:yes gene_type:complete